MIFLDFLPSTVIHMCANSWLLFHKAHDIFIKQATFKVEVDEELCKVSPSEKVIQKRKSSNHNECNMSHTLLLFIRL